jgi:hypothetical protein
MFFVNVPSNLSGSNKSDSLAFLNQVTSLQTLSKSICKVVHSKKCIPAVINQVKDISIRIVPFIKLLCVLYDKDVIFSFN